MKTLEATCAHEKLRNDLIALIKADHADMPAHEILCVVAVFLGQLIAFQDQRRFSADEIMQMVSANIQAGNRGAIEATFGNTAGSA